MRPIALRAVALISIAVALSPAPAAAKPPGTPKPQDAREAQRLFESRGGARILARSAAPQASKRSPQSRRRRKD